MVPVELKLTNFLSYGTAAPALDFEQFHVACLSGRNGQGKSALLDAVTWALWGEARKSGDSRKPDDELLHIGARRMQVDFVFDVEGLRYRVSRSYQKSASGKTSKPTLELHVFEPETDSYRPLTGGSIRETQEAMNHLLGLDYSTFINSAFLLQGRSDEFTKKRPRERKEILGRILDLARYDRLADITRQKERGVAFQIQQADHEIERLHHTLESEDEWKGDKRLVDAQLAETHVRLQQARDRERQLNERLIQLETKETEAKRLREMIQKFQDEQRQRQNQISTLEKRLQEAGHLISQSQQIQQDYDRYQRLLTEREALDEKQVLYRGVEQQYQAKEAELRNRRVEQEKRLHALEVELRSKKGEAHTCSVQLAEVLSVRRRLADAKKAKQHFDEQTLLFKKRQEHQEAVRDLERKLLGMREARQGEIRTLETQIQQEERRQPAIHELERQLSTQRARARQQHDREAALERLIVEGQRLNELAREHSGQNKILEDTLTKKEQALLTFQQGTEGECPVCGTKLSAHRHHEVEAEFVAECEMLRAQLTTGRQWIEAKKLEIGRLRQRFKAAKQEVEGGKAISERVAALEVEVKNQQAALLLLQEKKTRLTGLKEALATKSYGQEERTVRRKHLDALDALPFDETHYEVVREQASQVMRFTERLRDLQEVAGRKEQLEQQIQNLDQQIAEQREAITSGGPFDALRKQIAMLQQQLALIGFDGKHFEDVRSALKELAFAGARLQELVNAQQNRTLWQEQLQHERQRSTQGDAEVRQHAIKVETIENELRERSRLQTDQRDQQQQIQNHEREVRALQQRHGQLSAKLSQAREDRTSLKRQRGERKEAQQQQALLKHLRAAFGKHGIPSLIIEQTLPEIEERSNELLDRLTEGRMHVRLETIKDKKTGGTKETLDIVITDEQGAPRPYETFSGGEAFRVNFALRIALAQLLAERSGVRIRTLFIDEGFGTQDAQGVQNLVEAIQIIQDDFDKILVITHLDQLKEAFPVRIEVEKDPVEGSRFAMIGA